MKGTEKSGVRNAEKEEALSEKLSKRAFLVGNNRKGGVFTPLPSWKRFHYHSTTTPPPVSARKLAAALWELHHHNMQRSSVNSTNGRHNRHRFRDKSIDLDHLMNGASPGPDLDQPESSGGLKKHIAKSLIKHHQKLERRNHAPRSVSLASYGSSMEVAPYDPATTPNSSLGVNDPRYNLKTSTELLKVLNRIWKLEEQHASNVSLIKALKAELGHSRVRIKELVRDQQSNRCEIDSLMCLIAEDQVARQDKEHDYRVESALQSVEDERKLRRRSESLHRKLARELSETKSFLSSALSDLEKERSSRKILEDLCDEFAKAIKGYENQVHFLKQKSDTDRTEDQDRLILHLSESWLDERIQTRLEEMRSGFVEKESIVDKLGFEIEAFLQAKHNDRVLAKDRRNSLESVPLNEAVSAPQDVDAENGSENSGSNCFELNKPGNGVALTSHISEIIKSKYADTTPGRIHERKSEDEGNQGVSTNSVITDNVVSSQIHHGTVRQWMTNFASPEIEVSESSTKLTPGFKENTLKAKLLEARTKAPRTRLKVFKGKS